MLAFCEPVRGWRRVSSRDTRTRRDWAVVVRQLLDADYPQADVATLVCHTLNTHEIASLYTAFDAPTAHRLALRLRIDYTPRHGSWLNIADMELSVLTRQCLTRRFASEPAMRESMTAWQTTRNATGCGATWRFTTADARIKVHTLYPQPDQLE